MTTLLCENNQGPQKLSWIGLISASPRELMSAAPLLVLIAVSFRTRRNKRTFLKQESSCIAAWKIFQM